MTTLRRPEGRPWEKGDVVLHPVHGEGRVIAVQHGGRVLRVVFGDKPGLPHLVQAAVVRRGATPVPDATATLGAADARQVLEALRLGVVPGTGLAELTVGREVELDLLRRLLERGRGMMLVAGHYGAGKTHFVDVAQGEGLRGGLVTARVTFDAEEVAPSHPLRLWRAVARGLTLPGGGGLPELLEACAGSEAHAHWEGARTHRYLSPVAWALASGSPELQAEALAWISGVAGDPQSLERGLRACGWRGPRVLALPDYRTFGQVLAYLLGGLAVWARDAGHRGVLLACDEAEYVDRLSGVGRDLAATVLRYLAVAALDDDALAFAPDRVYRGGQPVHRDLPSRFAADQPLVVLAAFTPNRAIEAVLSTVVASSSAVCPLDPLPWNLVALYAARVLEVHGRVYPQTAPSVLHRRQLEQALQSAWRRGRLETLRQVARAVVEWADLHRDSPERALRALT